MKIKLNNNIELAYEKSGSGKPLILLHGNGEDHHIFDKIILRLQEDFTVYAIDSRNHGESSSDIDYSYESMSKDIYYFITELNLANVNIIGFSDGAIISLVLSMNHPQLIEKMAILGVNLKPTDFTEENYQFIKEEYENTKDPLLKLMLENPNIELHELKNITIPTLVVAAEEDIFKPETFVNITKALPNASLIIMNGHSHDSYIVNEDILYPQFLEFFA